MSKKKIAIACQGGGTHAAFTWGVLTKILETKKGWDDDAGNGETFDITALSGTSAGALCALAAWYGLAPNDADPGCDRIKAAIERLDVLWHTFAATTPVEHSFNAVVDATMQLKEKGVPFPASDPYSVSTDLALKSLSLLGAREQYLSFPALLETVCPHFEQIDWEQVARANLRMLAGAIEVQSGNFEVFDSHKTLEKLKRRESPNPNGKYETRRWQMRRPLTLEGVAGSGTLPDVLRAQRISDTRFPTREPGKPMRRDAFYWDGLYSQNPPVRQFLDAVSLDEKPDEIWVIRINPQEIDHPPTSIEEIRDRQNELAGNISLNAELDHILTINRWLADHGAEHPGLSARKTVEVRTIKMTHETARALRASTKFDRSQPHLERLRREGHKVAGEWLAAWRARGAEFDAYPDDARYAEST